MNLHNKIIKKTAVKFTFQIYTFMPFEASPTHRLIKHYHNRSSLIKRNLPKKESEVGGGEKKRGKRG